MRLRPLGLAAACIALLDACVTTPPRGGPRPPARAAPGTAFPDACVTTPPPAGPLARIDTIVVIYAENHSFDNIYGMFPGANGVASAFPHATQQVDHDGKVLPHL